nr:Chain C, Nitric oxide synthase, brain [synthetic construct]1CMI_D Chain D, Nitric oxide synthase, brain [synthetic construct]
KAEMKDTGIQVDR